MMLQFFQNLDSLLAPGLMLLLEIAIKGVLLLWVVSLIYRGFKTAPASLRHGFLAVALIGLLALTLGSPLMPAFPLPNFSWFQQSPAELPVVSSGQTRPKPKNKKEKQSPLLADEPLFMADAEPVASGPVADKNRLAWLAFSTVAVWLLGCFWLLAKFLAEVRWLRRLSRESSEPEPAWCARLAACKSLTGISRPVRLIVHHRETIPLTWGVLRPVILLPATAK